MYCKSCGNEVVNDAFICPNCGVKIQSDTVSEKSKIVAGLLALFLGTLGIHNFYLGYNGKGIAHSTFVVKT